MPEKETITPTLGMLNRTLMNTQSLASVLEHISFQRHSLQMIKFKLVDILPYQAKYQTQIDQAEQEIRNAFMPKEQNVDDQYKGQ